MGRNAIAALYSISDLLITSELLCQLSHTSILIRVGSAPRSVFAYRASTLQACGIIPQIPASVNSYFSQALVSAKTAIFPAFPPGNTQRNHFPADESFPPCSALFSRRFFPLRQNNQSPKIDCTPFFTCFLRIIFTFFDRDFPLHLVYIILFRITSTRSYPHFPHLFPHGANLSIFSQSPSLFLFLENPQTRFATGFPPPFCLHNIIVRHFRRHHKFLP